MVPVVVDYPKPLLYLIERKRKHFDVIIMPKCIAFVTPPVASNLFVAMTMTGLSMNKLVRVAWPLIVALFICLFICGYVPGISPGILDLFGVPY